MRKRSVSRRRFLAGAGAGGAALALGAAGGAVDAAPAAQGSAVTPQLLGQLAQYANFPLPPERAAELAPLVGGPLGALRAMRPDGYDNLEPAVIFRVPARACS